MLFKMTFILLEILKGGFFWPNHASVVLPALGNYDRQLPNLRFCPERKAASRFCPFRCASKRHFQPWAGSNCDYFRFLFLDDTKHRGIRVAMWPHARCLQTTSLGLADSMSDRRRHRFNSSQILTATRKWWKWGLRCQRKTTESERERETDKEWTGLDGVVTHTDGYIHIYNQVKSDRLHLNLHLFYSFFLSVSILFIFSLFLSRLVILAPFSPFLWLATEVLICPPIGRELSLLLALPLSLLFPIMPMVGEQELRVCPIIVWAINQSWRAQATWKETSVAAINRTPPTTPLSLSQPPVLCFPSRRQKRTDKMEGWTLIKPPHGTTSSSW